MRETLRGLGQLPGLACPRFADVRQHFVFFARLNAMSRKHLLVWAILAGALWAVANTLTVFAIRDVGLAIAFPMWNTNALVGLFWGRVLFRELDGADGKLEDPPPSKSSCCPSCWRTDASALVSRVQLVQFGPTLWAIVTAHGPLPAFFNSATYS